MKKLSMMTSLAILLLTLVTASARPQRPATAPPTAPSGKPPDTVMLEELTWAEVRDLIAGGVTTVIIGTAGARQKGPPKGGGGDKFRMEDNGGKNAHALRQTP